MELDRRSQISHLYHATVARSADERGAFLAEACGGDLALRHEIESLLAFESAAVSFLETPAPETLTVALETRGRRSHDWASVRAIHDREPSWRGRDGRGLQGPRRPAGPRRSRQGPSADLHDRPRAARPIRTRSASARRAEPPTHRGDLRH